MVCLAPRAPGDSVRPGRLSGVVVRPLNFTVSREPSTYSSGLRLWARHAPSSNPVRCAKWRPRPTNGWPDRGRRHGVGDRIRAWRDGGWTTPFAQVDHPRAARLLEFKLFLSFLLGGVLHRAGSNLPMANPRLERAVKGQQRRAASALRYFPLAARWTRQWPAAQPHR